MGLRWSSSLTASPAPAYRGGRPTTEALSVRRRLREASMRLAQSTIVAALLVLAGCAKPERSRLERGVAYARRQFVEASRNPVAAASLGSAAEMGGNLSSYIYAGMPDNADLPRFQDDRPSGPWSVALRALGSERVVIEGFGESLDRPVLAETVVVRFGPRH